MNESTEVRTDGNSLLKAVYLSRLRLTRLLLEGGAYINESNDLGETPLMVACKTHHSDTQSVAKHKIVGYLLENGADPNIQDKTGKTALIHACLEQAGAEILSLLLNSGADPTLEDHQGLSALVYAVNSGKRDVLNVLLDACKAKGKEVIIITTNKLPSGDQATKQYLNVPPPPELEDRLQDAPSSCSMSPYARMPPQGSSANTSPQPGSPLLGLKRPQSSGLVTSQPGSPIQNHSPLRVPGVDKRLNFHRLHYDHWPKSSSMLLQQCQSSSLTEDQTEITPEEELSLRVKNSAKMISKDAAGLLNALENLSGNGTKGGSGRKALGRKMSYDSAATSRHSASHPNLHQDESLLFPRESNPAGKNSSDCLQQLNVSSLQNVVHRRNIGFDHYSSDSQLPQLRSRDNNNNNSSKNSSEAGTGLEKLRLVNSRPFTLYGSKESLESPAQRRVVASLERRGSGALLLDHISHTRPGYLPSLKPHAPIPNIGVNATHSYPLSGSMKTLNGAMAGSKPIVPCAPLCSKDPNPQKMLWRRHSMQNEQLTHLVNFEETCGH